MLLSKAPLRVSLFGGGTDHPEYFNEHGGAVLGGAIDKYCYVLLNKFNSHYFEYKFKLSYSTTEISSDVNEIKHNIYRECIKSHSINEDISIYNSFDLPALSGLGTSSALTVATLQALDGYSSEISDPQDLARKAINIERELVNASVGYQDQIFAAYGGFNFIKFENKNKFTVKPVKLTENYLEELNSKSLLVYTGLQRDSSDVAGKQVKNIGQNITILNEMKSIALEGVAKIQSECSMDEIGKLLQQSWRLKRRLASEVTDYRIDEIYNTCIRLGAYGGKLLGAGAGGFIYLLASQSTQQEIINVFSKRRVVKFKFAAPGSAIIFKE